MHSTIATALMLVGCAVAAPVDQELVIAAAPTCYRLRQVAYTAGTYGRGEDDRVFTRTQLFWTAPLMYFLEEAPQTITSRDVGEMRRELRAIDCKRSVRTGFSGSRPGTSRADRRTSARR